MSKVEQKLTRELGIILPEASSPVANYVSFKKIGNLVFLSGQLPKINGEFKQIGKVGKDLTLDEAQQGAYNCGLNLLAHLKVACGGDLDKVNECVKLTIFVNAADKFYDLPLVANGVSGLMVKAFGEKGKHTRTTIGVACLPSNAAVEVEAIFSLI
ncbi:MAG: RidA family protein [Candidatus Melainabacteria bacterium]|jgi:enamine deaminase RidA (YjgF/YER057c/UK114 family)